MQPCRRAHHLSRTDVECEWKKQKAPEQVKSVEELYPCSKEYNCLTREVNSEDRSWFHQELKKYGNFTGTLWLLSPEPDKSTVLPVKTVEDIVLCEEFLNHADKTSYLIEKLRISEDQRVAVNTATIGQRDKPSWQMLRKGRLTASNFGSVLNCKRVTVSLIKRILGQRDLSRVQAINWGIINENEAKKVFQQKTHLCVEESGLWLQLSGMLGAFPDGLIGKNALLEVKCPFTQRDSTIEEAVASGNFYIKKNDEGHYELDKEHSYWHQVQGQLHLTERDLCYFVVWTTKETLVLQIKKDPAWADNLRRLQDFYTRHNPSIHY